MFKCYHCGDDLRWNNDYDAEDDEDYLICIFGNIIGRHIHYKFKVIYI